MGTGRMHNGAREHVGSTESIGGCRQFSGMESMLRGWDFPLANKLGIDTPPSMRKTWRSFRLNHVDQAGVGY